MPISSDRGSVNTAPIASVGEGNITPAVGDLMQAFRNGFITVDDLTRRGASLPADIASSQQNYQDQLQIRPLTRQQAVGQVSSDIALQPKRAANAVAASDLQAGQIKAATNALPTDAETQASDAKRAKDAQFLNALSSGVAGVPQQAIASATNEQIVNAWTASHGQAPPDSIEVPGGGGVTGKPIDEWYLERHGPIPREVDAQAVINRPDIQAEYSAYVKEAANRPMTYFNGDPQYIEALKKDLDRANIKGAVQAAEIKALPGVYEAQAKATAEAPGKKQTADAALQKEYGTRQEIQDLRRVQAAYYKLQNLLDPAATPSAPRDQGAIFSWMKILDPGSTVREGEYATAKNARGVPESIKAWYNQTISGQILTPDQRTKFKEAVEPVYRGQVQAVGPTIRQFLSQESATGSVVPPEDATALTKAASAGPAAASSGASGVKPGDVVILKDGRRIRVKAVTATGIVPDTENPVQ